jgi:hypothetical protein
LRPAGTHKHSSEKYGAIESWRVILIRQQVPWLQDYYKTIIDDDVVVVGSWQQLGHVSKSQQQCTDNKLHVSMCIVGLLCS